MGKELDIKRAENKPSIQSLPVDALMEVARVFSHGAVKHGANSWRDAPTPWTERFGSMLRHVYAALNGQDIDPDTNEDGCYHLAEAIAQGLFLLEYVLKDIGEDDRYLQVHETPPNYTISIPFVETKTNGTFNPNSTAAFTAPVTHVHAQYPCTYGPCDGGVEL